MSLKFGIFKKKILKMKMSLLFRFNRKWLDILFKHQLEPTLLIKSSWYSKKSLIWKLDLVQICWYMKNYAKLISENLQKSSPGNRIWYTRYKKKKKKSLGSHRQKRPNSSVRHTHTEYGLNRAKKSRGGDSESGAHC